VASEGVVKATPTTSSASPSPPESNERPPRGGAGRTEAERERGGRSSTKRVSRHPSSRLQRGRTFFRWHPDAHPSPFRMLWSVEFVNASFRFMMKPTGDYTAYFSDSDM
jgi:hypothetical protein